MKSIIILLLLLCGLQFLATGQSRIIQNPVIGNPGTDAIDILEIICSDTATIIRMDIYDWPGDSISIPSQTILQSADGQRIYKLTSTEGIERDKPTIIPEQGYISCRLWFEPLSHEEKTINYVEGKGADAPFLGNIRLYEAEKKNGSIHCLLRGEVKYRPYSSRLLIYKYGDDPRLTADYIPIRNGKFEYMLVSDECEVYNLAFEDEWRTGAWIFIDFLAYNGEIRMTLYPDYKNNKIEGGRENRSLREFKHSRDEAVPLAQINAKISKLREEGNSSEVIEKETQKLLKERETWIMDYIRKSPSLACYYILKQNYDSYMTKKREVNFLDKAYEQTVKELVNTVYRSLYPSHPYTIAMDACFNHSDSIKTGGHYVDFTAPNLATGDIIRLSEQIEGKLALIDLWASWCGYCRQKAMDMIPVYEKYKEKGFTIIGVARERSQITGLKAARQDRHPWLDLLDLNGQEEIWKKYGIGNSGGRQFLVDRDGKILAINPTVEEVERILKEKTK